MPALVALEEAATWEPLVDAPSVFLFLDFDGTLVEIAPRPSDVFLASQRRQCLQELLSTPGLSVAVVSGRQVDDLRRIIGLDDLFYVGGHGLEWIAPRGTKTSYPVGKPVMDALQCLREQFRNSVAHLPGVLVEDKGTALALHYRMALAPTARTVKSELVRAVHSCQQTGVPLEILEGKEVIEARPAAMNKGDAVRQLLKAYTPNALPAYVGDDVTDEAAFHAVRGKGWGVLVAESPRPTAASHYLRSPSEVYEFLWNLVRLRRETA